MIATRANTYVVEGVVNTPGIVLLRAEKRPARVTLAGKEISSVEFSEVEKLLWIRFQNEASPRELSLAF